MDSTEETKSGRRDGLKSTCLTKLTEVIIERKWDTSGTPTEAAPFTIYPAGNMWTVLRVFQGILVKLCKDQIVVTYCFISSFSQVRTMLEEKQYAIQIKEAFDLIKESKESVNEHKVKYNARKEFYNRSQLKHKGKMRLTK